VKRERNRLSPKVASVVEAMSPAYSAKSDPLGMYTGRPVEPLVKPVQDADDL